MGTRMPIDSWPVGDECIWFPDPPKTPLKIYVYFFGIKTCAGFAPPPNLHVFTCFQDESSPCFWRNAVAHSHWDVRVIYYDFLHETWIALYDENLVFYFEASVVGFAAEHVVFGNNWDKCNHVYGGADGCAMLFWHEAALNLINDLVIPNDGETFLEFMVNDEQQPIYKFCNIKYSLNQKFLVEP